KEGGGNLTMLRGSSGGWFPTRPNGSRGKSSIQLEEGRDAKLSQRLVSGISDLSAPSRSRFDGEPPCVSMRTNAVFYRDMRPSPHRAERRAWSRRSDLPAWLRRR